MSLATTALLFIVLSLPSVGASPLAGVGPIAVVADPASPVVIEKVSLERTSKGVVVVCSLRNESKDVVKGIVLTAAALDWTGTVKHVQMVPLSHRMAAGSLAEQRATFASVELSNAERIHVGVQAVQWSARRQEWRGSLKLNAPVALASRD